MDAPECKSQFAWQPLTPRGVAAFACASVGRLVLVQFVVASLVAAAVLWFLSSCWFPVIRQSLDALPETGQIRSGILEWTENSPVRLAEGHFLAIVVDVSQTGLARSTAHVSVEFDRSGLRIFSFFGFIGLSYPSSGTFPFNRTELLPWWGAWNPFLLAGVAVCVISGLMLTWWLLALFYCLPVWVMGFFTDRDLSLKSSWRLAGAALLPGALFMAGCVFLYGLAYLDLFRLGLGWAVHLAIGWIYLFCGTICAPRAVVNSAVEANPFTPSAASSASSDGAAPAAQKESNRD
jgi:hypothetical protein